MCKKEYDTDMLLLLLLLLLIVIEMCDVECCCVVR